MPHWNLTAVWVAFLLGVASGAATGLFFDREEWLGGYTSWRRRLVRLGHISFFGLGFVNLAFVLSMNALGEPFVSGGPLVVRASSVCLIAGLALMPTVCFLSAWRRGFKALFFLPVTCVLAGVAGVLLILLERANP